MPQSLAAGAAVAGMGLKAYGTLRAGDLAAQQGSAEREADNYRATLLEQQAGQTRAASQRTALDQRRQTTLVESRARAVAAASGAGASDSTVNDIEGRIAQRGEYAALSSLFNGEERARGLEDQGAGVRFEGAEAGYLGKQKQSASRVAAIAGLLSGGSDLYSKYGAS